MKEKLRKTGIGLIGNVPWGTHFCQFYQTREDLADILIPYFKAGLENNEFCMWITSGPLDEKEAKNAMKRAIPHFDKYRKRGQIEIIPHTEWYLKSGAFNQKKVLDSWIDKLDQALAKGYDGMRVTGNTAWLEKRDWKKFTDYEEEINKTIGEHRMLAICTYWLDECGAAEVIDVVSNHQFALIRQEGKWKSIESSERKQAKDEIVKSEQKYRSLIERTGAGVATSDLKGKFTYVNDSLCKMIGYSKDELIGKTFTDFLHPGDKKKIMQIFLNAFKNPRKHVELDFRVIHKKGHEVYMNSSPTVFIHNGKVLGFSAIITDTTERKKAEEALIESEDQYKTIFELAPDGIITINKKGIITACSPSFIELSGFSKNDIVGKHFSKAPTLNVKEVPKYIKMFISMINGKIPKPFEILWKHKNGSSRLAEVRASLMRKNLEIVGIQGIARDITERKKTEAALRESEKRHKELVDLLPQGVFELDTNGNFTYLNRYGLKLTGYSQKEISGGFNVSQLMIPEDRERLTQTVSKIMVGEKSVGNEYTSLRKDGSQVPVMIYSRPIILNKKPVGLRGTVIDITDHKRAQGELEKSRAKLRNLAVHLQSVREQELSKIAGDIHDDLAQSLTALKMDMVFLSRKIPEGYKEMSDKLKSMIDLTDVTIQTVRSLCAELRPSVLDDLGLAEAVKWYAEGFQNRTGIRCDVSIVPENFPAKEERSTAVFRIFQETLTNVALHAEATVVKVELRSASGNLELEVKDNGKGITREQLTDAKSFGLIGIRERVKAFGGEDRIIGEAGKGTVVKVRIPLLVEN